MNNLLTSEKLTQYLEELRLQGYSVQEIKKKVNALHAFISWCYAQNKINSDVYNSLIGVLITLKVKRMSIIEIIKARVNRKAKLKATSKSKAAQKKSELDGTKQPFTYYVGFALLLILMAVLGAGLYNQLFKPKINTFAYPTTLTRGTRILSFQGRLTDTLSNPIVTTTDVVFKLYTAASGGTLLYTGSCTGVNGVVPDNDGIFNTLIGSDCGMSEIPATVFSENPNVFLGITVGSDSEMTPRQQIANVGYALNSETLQGLPPGKNVSMIPYINDQGDVLVAASAPGLRSTYASATFNISSANAITLASAGSGDITLNASQSGTLKFQTAGTDRITVVNNGNIGIGNVTNPSSFNVQVAGHVGPNATDTYDLGSISQEWRNIYGLAIYQNGVAVCDANGTNCPAGANAWTLNSPFLYPTQSLYRLGVGTTATASMISELYVTRTLSNGALGKALAVFNQTENQELFTASASGVPRFTVLNDGTLQFHQASSITTTTGNLTLNSTGGTTTVSDNLVVTGTSDLQGVVSNSTGNVVLGDIVDLGSASTGVNVTTTGVISDSDGNLVLNDVVDIGSSTTGLNVTSTGLLSDIDGNLVLNDTVDIGSTVTGLNITTAGVISDTDGSVTINDHLLPNTDATFDLGSTAASWRDLYLTGQICFDDTDCFSSASSIGSTSGWSDDGTVVRLTTSSDFVGIGTSTPTGKLQVEGKVTGKALAIFNETGDQAILTASASGAPRFTVLNDGTLQFHQASSITTTTGNLTLNSTGGTTTVSDNLVVTGTSDLQGAVSDSTGNLVLDDTTDIGSSVTGINVSTTGLLSDIDGNLVLNDTVDIGSTVTGLNVTTAGLITDLDGNVVIGDTVDLGSASTGVNVTTTGVISDSDGNLVLNDVVDIGSSVTGLNVTTTGLLSDIDGNLVLNDTVDIGSTVTGLNITVGGNVTDIDGNIVLSDTVDIGSSTNGLRVDTGGVVSDINGNIVLNDAVDIGSSVTGINVSTTGLLSDIDGNLVLNDTVDIGSTVTGLNITTTGVISDTDGSVLVNDHLLPNTDATFDLGDTANSWRNMYLTGQICFDDTDCFSSSPGNISGWNDDGTVVRLTTDTDFVGIGTSTPTGKLQVEGKVTGKALAIFNETGDQAILTASASGTSRLTVLNDGTLQFHQASSITTTTGNLTLNSTGGTTTVSDNLVVTGTSDLQGAVSNSTGNLVLDDNTDIGSATTGVNVTTGGVLSDTDGNLILNDVVDIGSSVTGLNITVGGNVTDIDGNIVLSDTVDIGSSTNGLRVDTGGVLSDINGNIVLNDAVDIGSSVTGINVTTTGLLSDIDGNLVLNDTVDIGSTVTGLNITVGGNVTDIDGNIVLSDTVDIGSSTNGLRVDTGGVVSDINGNIVLNDAVDIGSSVTGLNVTVGGTIIDIDGNIVLNDATDIGSSVTGINVTTTGLLSDIDGNLVLNDTVDIGSTVTGLNITTAGVLSDIDGNVTINDHLAPNTDATYDLGTTAASWRDIYLTGQLCFDDTDCTSSFATGFIQLQSSTPGSQQTGNLNISGAALAGYFADTSNTAYGLDPAGTSNFGGYSLKVTGGTILALDSGVVGIGTGAPVGKLHVDSKVTGKALSMFNELGDQAILTASASGVSKLTILNDGTLQFHQASSITTTTGNLTLNSTGGTTTVSDNLVVTGTSDLQGAISNSTGNLILDDTVDIGSAANGLRVDTGGVLSDINGNLVLNDTVDIGSSVTGINITTTGLLSDIDGNLILNDTVDIGSTVTGLNITTAGVISDTDGSVTINDHLLPNTDATFDLGNTATSWRDIYLTGQLCFDDVDCISSSPNTSAAGWTDGGTTVYLTATTDAVGIGVTAATSKLQVTGKVTGKALAIFDETGDQNIIAASASGVTKFIVDHNGNVGIGTTNAAGKLTILQSSTSSTDGIYFANSTNSGRGYLDSSGNLRLQSATNNSQLVLHNAGNVGVGTTNPLAQFSVGSSSQFQVNSTGNLTSINNVAYSWPSSQGGSSTVLTNNGSGTLTWTAAATGTVTGTGSAGQATFWTGTSAVSGDNSFWWDNTNKLFGLGTNAPVAKLHLDGAVKGKALAIFNETGDQDVLAASASGTPVFNIKHNGNVGIGTTAPTAKLEIAGTTSTISNTSGNINITPTADLVVTSGNVGIGAAPVSGGKLYLNTTNSNTINSVTMNIGNVASTSQNNWNTLNIQNGGTGYLDLELVRGFVNNQGVNHIEDDFTSDSIDTNKWGARTATGTGASCTLPASVLNGVFRETTGTTAASSCMLRAGGGTGEGIYQMDNNAIYEAAVKMGSSASNQRAYFGFSNGAITGDANTSRRHAWIGKRAADTTWQCVTGNGTTETFTSTGVAISTTTFQRLRVQLGGGSTNQVVCSVNGTAVSVTATLPGTGQLMDIYAMTESTGTSAVHDVDYVRAWQDDPPGVAKATPQVPVAFDPVQRSDIAEAYLHDPNVKFEPGDVVSISDNKKIVKSNGTYDKKVLGVISTSPNQVMGMSAGDTDPVALTGRVPVKVTTANGQIHAGDYLTASSIPGVAMKASQPGVVIGKALDDFITNDPNTVGKVLMFINLTWYDSQIAITNTGDINVAGIAPIPVAQTVEQQNNLIKGVAYAAQQGGQTLNNIEGYAKVVAGTVSSGLVETQNAIVKGILSAQTVIATNITAANQTVTNLTANSLTTVDGLITNLTVGNTIKSPIVETDTLTVKGTATANEVQTSTIKAKDSDVTVDISKDTSSESGKLASLLIKGLNNKTVATIDSAGNATLSGSLAAKSATISGELAAGSIVSDSVTAKDASLSGTVKAKEVIADNIDALSQGLNSTQNSVASQSSALQSLSGDMNNIQQLLNELKNQPLPDPSYYQNMNQPVPASNSGQLQSNLGETIVEKLTVTGYTLLSDAYVANSFAAGDVQIQGNSVLALSSELRLSALDNINLFDGAVMIAKDGTITTRGEVIAQGGVRTNEIKPLNAGDDLKVTLSKNTQSPSTGNAILASAAQPKLKIQDSTGTEVASIDASGSAKFRDLAIDQYLEATSSSAVVSAQDNFNNNGLYAPAITTNGKTIGVGSLPTNSNIVAIYNEKVTSNSLIYVTPTSPTDNKTLYIAEKVGCENVDANTPCKPHFTVAISGTVPHDIQFNWWIIN